MLDNNNQQLIAAPYGDILTASGHKALLNNILFDNCSKRKDVLDALTRQANSKLTMPYTKLRVPGIIQAVDYDMGREGIAYHDLRSERLQIDEPRDWNASKTRGGYYRNDGVDIETNSDEHPANGYNVGFMDAGEWMKYTVWVNKSGIYQVKARISGSKDFAIGKLSVEVDNHTVASFNNVASDKWISSGTIAPYKPFYMSKGAHQMMIKVEAKGCRLNWLEFISED